MTRNIDQIIVVYDVFTKAIFHNDMALIEKKWAYLSKGCSLYSDQERQEAFIKYTEAYPEKYRNEYLLEELRGHLLEMTKNGDVKFIAEEVQMLARDKRLLDFIDNYYGAKEIHRTIKDVLDQYRNR